MRSARSRALVLVLGALVAAACGGTDWSATVASSTTLPATGTTTPARPEGWVDFQDPSGISLQHPADWEVQPGRLGPLIVYVDATPDTGGFRRNVNVLVQTVDAGTTNDDYLQLTLDQVDRAGWKVEDSRATTLGGLPGHMLTSHVTKGARAIRFLSVWTVRGRDAYLVTYTSDIDNFAAPLPDVKRLIASIRLPSS